MKLRTKIAIGLIAAVAIVATPVIAQRQGWTPFQHDPARMLDHVSLMLDLTDAQKQTAKTLFESARSQAEPVIAQLKQGHEEISAAVKSNNTAALDTLSARQGALIGQVIAIHTKTFGQFYTQLTPAQKEKAEKIHTQMQSGFMNHFAARQ